MSRQNDPSIKGKALIEKFFATPNNANDLTVSMLATNNFDMNKLVVNKGSGRRAYSCLDCDSDAVYYDQYDTFACIKCDQWLDVCTCGPDDHCPYPKPPAKPSSDEK